MCTDLIETHLAITIFKETIMKLTKQKLEQLITEEYVRRIGDEDKPTNRPEYADKLTTLAKSDPKQAASLADSLDEPLDIEFDPSNMDYFPIDSEFGKHLQSPEYQLLIDFLHWGPGTFSLEEEPDIGEVYQFSQELGLDPEETYKKIMKSYHFYRQNRYIKNNKFKSTDKRVPDTWFDRENKFY